MDVTISKYFRTGRSAAAAGLALALALPVAGAAEPAKQAGIEQERAAPVTNLPYARGRSFLTLDEYLAFRRKGGALDLPWYREVRPGLYQLETGNLRPAGPERLFTREELERKFGFAG
jgi:hypothetical protein